VIGYLFVFERKLHQSIFAVGKEFHILQHSYSTINVQKTLKTTSAVAKLTCINSTHNVFHEHACCRTSCF